MLFNETPGATQLAIVPEEMKLSIKRILCPIDFTEFSERALRYAISLARHFSAQLYVQYVAELPQFLTNGGPDPIDAEAWQRQIPEVEQEIRELLEQNGISTSEARVLVSKGRALDRILETISGANVDLLVMGTHGHKGFNHLLLGSVTEGAIHRVPCPVLAISRPQKDFIHPEEPETVRLKTILFATDFSSNSDRALYYTLKWASEWAAKVVIVHVVPETPGLTRLFPEYNPYFERQVTSAWQKIHQVLPESVEQTCEVRYEVRQGNPKDEILRVAQEKAADLIIMGAQGSGDAAALWGSVSSAVVRAGRLPVLVVRARQHLLWRC